jgi:hypothetical protein
MLLSGPRTQTLGTEPTLTCNFIAKSGGGDHLYDSCIIDDGTTVCVNATLKASGQVCGMMGNFGCIGIGNSSPTALLDICHSTNGYASVGLQGYTGAYKWYVTSGISGTSIHSFSIGNCNDGTNSKFTIMYFCEDVDIDDVNLTIQFLQEKFPNYKFVRGDNSLEDWEQMVLMSCCHHNIIANSSFSWWSAYFNSWTDKLVCYPSVWFGPSANHDTNDLCPVEWIRISA